MRLLNSSGTKAVPNAMMHPLHRAVVKSSQRLSLQAVLMTVFVLQILGVVGLVGYLSFRNGQKAVEDLAGQLVSEVSDRIDQHLTTYLTTPQQINQLNLFVVEQELINLKNQQHLAHYFWKQMQVFPNIGYVDFANTAGEFVGVGREDDGSLYLEVITSQHLGHYRRYSLDQTGNPDKLLWQEAYNPLEDDWYSDAVAAQKPVWSKIYQWPDQPEIFSISSSYPVYTRSHQLIGVIGIDHILSQTNDFLKSLKVSSSGRIFILERNGLIVASSSLAQAYVESNGTFERLNALNSGDPLIHATAHYLMTQFGSLEQIQQKHLLHFNFEGKRQFVQISPWKDKYGLDWLVVIAVPASDFMGQIDTNTHTTIALCILALLTAVMLALLTAQWVTKPILRLNSAARKIAQGKWEETVSMNRQDELGELANSFNEMAKQLKNAFETLEQKVNERTQALSETLEQLQATQAQVIAQEKLASLGVLTAGIAHEIKNPLNFINNFAELSIELTVELLEIITQQKSAIAPEDQATVEELLANLSQNAEKIYKHGQRADQIVRGMLLHSRGECTDRQLTDLNTLLTEAVYLSYYGMRAQYPSFKLNLEIEVDDRQELIRIVASDISRVFLNIINNACYATHIRTQQEPYNYVPTLWVTTRDMDAAVQIRIRDNGIGMPQNIRNRIFEPFFTTKPTGEGTGLGLSISHDILLEHQGSIQVMSEVNQYTEFIITLPKADAVIAK